MVAFRDRQERYFQEWGELLGLGRAERRRLRLVRARRARRRRPRARAGPAGLVARQGRLRAHVLAPKRARLPVPLRRPGRPQRDPRDRARARAHRRRSTTASRPTRPYRGLRIADEAALRCAYRDGVEPLVVHQYVRKPWLEPTYDGVYSRLLRRLLTADDVAIRVPEDEVPLRLRAGARARAERAARQRSRLPALALRRPPPRGDRKPHRGPPKGADEHGLLLRLERASTSSAPSASSTRCASSATTEPIFLLDCGLTRRAPRRCSSRT